MSYLMTHKRFKMFYNDIFLDAPNKYSTYLKSRPPKMEENAVKVVTDLCGKYR